MKVEIKPFSRLSCEEFHAAIALRLAVFVVEQNCPYQDLDGKDLQAFHLLVWNDDHKLTGTLRILSPGTSYKEPSIGRVASHPDFRNKGIGHRMMEEAMQFIHENYPGQNTRISAQTYLCRFYEQYGFTKTGKEYLEDGIPHSEMLTSISNS